VEKALAQAEENLDRKYHLEAKCFDFSENMDEGNNSLE
jgi:hypothetical protein